MELNTKIPPYYLRKIGATLIDYGLYFVLFYFYIMFIGVKDPSGTYTVNGLPAIFPIIFWFAYFPFAELIFSSTIGHYIFDLKVIMINNKGLQFSDTFKRRIIDPIDLFFYGIPAFILISKSDLSQRLGDVWAGTIVVRKDEIEHIQKYLSN